MKIAHILGLSGSEMKKGQLIYRSPGRSGITSITALTPGQWQIAGWVQGTARDPYKQQFKLFQTGPNSAEVIGQCSCPVGYNCKHIAALVHHISLDTAYELPRFGSDETTLTHDTANKTVNNTAQGTAPPAAPSNAVPQALQRWLKAWQPNKAPDERTIKQMVRDAQPKAPSHAICYLLSAKDGHLRLELNKVGRRKAGFSDKRDPLYRSIDDIAREKPAYFDPTLDGQVFRLINAMALGAYKDQTHYRVEGPFAHELLQAVATTRRAGTPNPERYHLWCQQTLEIRKETYELGLNWQSIAPGRFSTEQEETIKPVFSVKNAGSAPNSGLVLLPEPYFYDAQHNSLTPVQSPLAGERLVLLLNLPAVPRSALPLLMDAMQTELPAAWLNDLVSEFKLQDVNAPPRFRIRLARLGNLRYPAHWEAWLPAWNNIAHARVLALELQYGDSQWLGVPAGGRNSKWFEPVAQERTRIRYKRDHAEEISALMQFVSAMGALTMSTVLGVDDHTDYNETAHQAALANMPEGFEADLHFCRAPTDNTELPHTVECAKAFAHHAGFGFVVDDDAAFSLREVSDVSMSVSMGSGGWFDVGYTVRMGDEACELAPLLQALLNTFPDLEKILETDFYQSLTLPLDEDRNHFVTVDLITLRPALKTLLAFLKPGQDTVQIPRFDLGLLQAQATDMRVQAPPDLLNLLQRFEDVIRDHTPALDPELKALLRPYQLEGVAWVQLLARLGLNGLLADDMGLGKTLQALAVLSAWATHTPGCSLVIAPNSLQHNWAAECQRFLPHWKIRSIEAGQPFPTTAAIEQLQLVILPFSLINRLIAELTNQQWQWVVVDESHRIKNAETQVARNLKKIPSQHRLALSGTPLENHLGEVWSQMDFLMPGLLGTRQQFERDWRKPIEKQNQPGLAQTLAARLRPFLRRRTKAQVASELPPKTEQIVRIALSDEQAQVYETVRALMDSKLSESLSRAGFAKSQIVFLEALLRLRQVCCDPRLMGTQAPSAKREVLIDLLQTLCEEGRSILVFSQFAEMLNLLAAELQTLNINFAMLTGQTKNREQEINRFTQGEAPIFLVSLKAGGVGLNLTKADTVIVYDPWWNPAAEQQAVDRSHRIGQTQPVTVIRLIAENTVEEKILALQARKQNLAKQMLDGQGLDIALTEEDFRIFLQAQGNEPRENP